MALLSTASSKERCSEEKEEAEPDGETGIETLEAAGAEDGDETAGVPSRA